MITPQSNPGGTDDTPHGGLRAILQRTLLSDESGQILRPLSGDRLDPDYTVVAGAPRVASRRKQRRRAH